MANENRIAIPNINIAVRIDRMGFRGFVSVILLLATRGRVSVWKKHGVLCIEELS